MIAHTHGGRLVLGTAVALFARRAGFAMLTRFARRTGLAVLAQSGGFGFDLHDGLAGGKVQRLSFLNRLFARFSSNRAAIC